MGSAHGGILKNAGTPKVRCHMQPQTTVREWEKDLVSGGHCSGLAVVSLCLAHEDGRQGPLRPSGGPVGQENLVRLSSLDHGGNDIVSE